MTARLAGTALFLATPLLVLLSVLPPFPGASRAGTFLLADVAQLAAALLAALFCAATTRRQTGRARLAWGAFTGAAIAWGAGQVAWTYYEVFAGVESPIPSIADVGFLLLLPFAAIGILVLAASPTQGKRGTVAALLDASLIAGSLFVVSWSLYLRAVFVEAPDAMAAAVSLAYPLGDLVLLGLASIALLRSSAPRRSPHLPLLVFVLLFAVADAGLAAGVFDASYATGQLSDAGWVLGLCALAFAASRFRDTPSLREYPSPLRRVLPLVAILVVLATGTAFLLGKITPDLVGRIALGLVTGLATGRLLASIWEQEHAALRQASAELALRESAARLAETQRVARLGRWELDVRTGIMSWSEECHHIFGMEPGTFEGTFDAFLARVHPPDRDKVRQAYLVAVESKKPYSVDHRIVLPDGRLRVVNEQGVTYYDADGAPVRSMGTVLDVTERVEAAEGLHVQARLLDAVGQADGRLAGFTAVSADVTHARAADAALRENEARLRAAESIAGSGSWEFELVAPYALTFSTGMRELLEVGDEPMSRETIDSVLDDEDRAIVHAAFHEALETGGPVEREYRIKTLRGRVRDVLQRSLVERDGTGKPIRHRGTLVDITERKRAESQFKTLMESAPDAMVIVDGGGAIRIVNAQTERMFGRSRDELLGQPIEALLLKGHHARQAAHVETSDERLHTRIATEGLALSGLRADGTEFPVEVSLAPLETEAGLLVTASIRDVTERKRMENERLEAEARYREVVETVADGIVMVKADGTPVFVNPAAAHMFGFATAADMLAQVQNTKELYPDPAQRAPTIERISASGTTVLRLKMKRRDGTLFWIETHTHWVTDAKGEKLVAAVFRDLTAEIAERAATSLLAAVVESAEEAIYSKSLDGTILTWNAAAERIFGYSEVEVVGQRALDIIVPPDARDDELKLLDAVRRGDRRPRMEALRMRRDGTVFPVSMSVSPLRDANGVIEGVSVAAYDITESKRSESQRQALEEDTRRAARVAHFATWTFDVASGKTRGSPEMLDVLGLDASAKPGRPDAWKGIFTPESLERLTRAMERALATGEPYALDLELAARRPGDNQRWVTHQAEAARDEEGRITGLRGVVQDITQRRRAEDQLRRNDRLSTLGTLVAGVAHEINNPLMYIRGSVEFLKGDALDLLPLVPPEKQEAIQTMVQEADTALRGLDRISAITKGLRQVARAPSLERTQERANLLIVAIIPVARPRMSVNIDVQLDLRSEEPFPCNATEISQVLLNLLLNAAEAMGEKGGCLLITSRDAGGEVIIDVADEGHGIPADQQAKLFSPFYTTKPHGTGLGLSVSQAIVNAHGGSLTFDTVVGRGTTFHVALPANPPGKAPTAANVAEPSGERAT